MPRWRRAASDEVEPPVAAIEVRPFGEEDRPWADEVELRSWGERNVVRLGESVDPTVLPLGPTCATRSS